MILRGSFFYSDSKRQPFFTFLKQATQSKKKSKKESFYEIKVKTIEYSDVFGYTDNKGGDKL